MSTPATTIRRDRFSPIEIAAANGIHVNTVYSLIYSGELQSIRIGRAYRISRAELERLGWSVPEIDTKAVA